MSTIVDRFAGIVVGTVGVPLQMSKVESILMILTRVLGVLLVQALLCSPLALAEGHQEYRLGVGDKVKVDVFGHPELSGDLVVDGGGNVIMPLINDVNAVGLTTYELADRITWKLKPDYLVNPRVTVELLSYRPYYILGEVNHSGSFPYVEGMTVLNAVALAGGFTDRANKKRIIIERKQGNGRKKLKVTADSEVQPGDVIVIKERFF
jgi:polysaccharide export outer membrane protein